MSVFSFYMPTRLFFGSGAVGKLSRARLPEGRGLIITGGSSTTKLGYVAKVAGILKEAGHETLVYDKVKPNPTIEGVRECAALWPQRKDRVHRRSGRRLVHRHREGRRDHGDQRRRLGGTTSTAARAAANAWRRTVCPLSRSRPRPAPAPRPTRSPSSPNGEEKIGGGGEKCFPAVSIVDPDFMMTVPPHLTAYQGFDAFFHAARGLSRVDCDAHERYVRASGHRADRQVARSRRQGRIERRGARGRCARQTRLPVLSKRCPAARASTPSSTRSARSIPTCRTARVLS